MAVVWLALAVSLVAVAVALVMTTRRGIVLYRDFKQLGTVMGDELASIERSAGDIEGHLAAATASGEALTMATARLADSRARLNVLLAAIADVRETVSRVTAFVPRK
jgi:hypothetical protein